MYHGWRFRLAGLIALAVMFCSTASASGVMPNVQPISVQPVGVAPGGGIQARYTYEMRLPLAAANDAGVAAAANDATYATRLVTIARTTGGGILEGGVALGSRAIPWVAAAYTAYQLYKWYTDANGHTQQQGAAVPSATCTGSSYWIAGGNKAYASCSAQASANKQVAYLEGHYANLHYTLFNVRTQSASSVYFDYHVYNSNDGSTTDQAVFAGIYNDSTAVTITDPGYNLPDSPIALDQIGQLAEQHPDWWPGMLTDPKTGAPLITPEVADDMDALKHQIAPEYGVDPQTLTPTTPDSDYVHGNPDPRAPTSLPSYCGWATEACDYYQWVEDHWPDKDPKQYAGNADCDTPPTCSGDEILCGIAAESWRTRCMFRGTGDPPQVTPPVVQDLYTDDKDLGDTSQLDMSGLGLSDACPFTSIDADFAGQGNSVSIDFLCDAGSGLKYLILIAAAWACAKIMAGVQTNT